MLVRVLPDGGDGDWWARRAAEQEAALAAAGGGRRGGPGAGARRCRGRDVADLAGLLPAGELPDPPVPAPPAPERLDGGWRLVLPLPFAERGAVDLTRWTDDLVVTAAGVRRSLRLDPLLRRCEVTGGRLADPGTAGGPAGGHLRRGPGAVAGRPAGRRGGQHVSTGQDWVEQARRLVETFRAGAAEPVGAPAAGDAQAQQRLPLVPAVPGGRGGARRAAGGQRRAGRPARPPPPPRCAPSPASRHPRRHAEAARPAAGRATERPAPAVQHIELS